MLVTFGRDETQVCILHTFHIRGRRGLQFGLRRNPKANLNAISVSWSPLDAHFSIRFETKVKFVCSLDQKWILCNMNSIRTTRSRPCVILVFWIYSHHLTGCISVIKLVMKPLIKKLWFVDQGNQEKRPQKPWKQMGTPCVMWPSCCENVHKQDLWCGFTGLDLSEFNFDFRQWMWKRYCKMCYKYHNESLD